MFEDARASTVNGHGDELMKKKKWEGGGGGRGTRRIIRSWYLVFFVGGFLGVFFFVSLCGRRPALL